MLRLRKTEVSLGLLALGIVLSVSARVDADFSVTTAVTGVTYSGGTLTSGSLAANTSYTENGIQFSTRSEGGSFYTDTQGTTIYFVEDSEIAAIKSVPNEQIFVINSTPGAIDTGTFVFSTLMKVMSNGSSGTFTEGPNVLALNLANGDQNYSIFATSILPPSLTIGGTLFTATLPQATSGYFNNEANGAVSASILASSTVPEPASLAMFGMGAIGIIGAMIRQGRKA